MKILITGGAGFIGSSVVDRYVANEHEVLVKALIRKVIGLRKHKKRS